MVPVRRWYHILAYFEELLEEQNQRYWDNCLFVCIGDCDGFLSSFGEARKYEMGLLWKIVCSAILKKQKTNKNKNHIIWKFWWEPFFFFFNLYAMACSTILCLCIDKRPRPDRNRLQMCTASTFFSTILIPSYLSMFAYLYLLHACICNWLWIRICFLVISHKENCLKIQKLSETFCSSEPHEGTWVKCHASKMWLCQQSLALPARLVLDQMPIDINWPKDFWPIASLWQEPRVWPSSPADKISPNRPPSVSKMKFRPYRTFLLQINESCANLSI